MLEWQACETEDEVMDELTEGLSMLSRNSTLSWISAIIYEAGYEFSEISERIEQMDNEVYNIIDPDNRYPEK